jgi:acyl-CoA thioester hydrolase
MARIKIEMPDHFPFTATLPVRIGDINYGGHLGNDAVLSLLHEARMQFLNSLGYTEMNLAGVSLIMSDAAIEFKGEAFYGDTLIAAVSVMDIKKIAFDIVYKLEKKSGTASVAIVYAKTGMVCYDYQQKKIASLPQEVITKLNGVMPL